MYGQLSPEQVKKTRLNICTQRTSELSLHIHSKNSRSAQGKSEEFPSVTWLNFKNTPAAHFIHAQNSGWDTSRKETTWKKRRR